ncbi:MAG: DUF4340 domain-containing protein [Clostridiales bacterium]|nr:DUF4340 domain-containing protein [Clostridiales bacterium]
MKNKILFIASLTALLVVLTAALILLRGADDAALPDALLASPRVFEIAAPVMTIVIEQAGKPPFTLQNLAGDGEIGGMLLGRESLPVDAAKVTAVLRAAWNLPMIELVEATPGRYDKYGLADPRARVALTAADGERTVIIIGDVAPGNIGVYIKLEAQSEVYLVPVYTLDNYLLLENDYLSHTITPSPGATLLFESIRLSGGGLEKDIIVIPDGFTGFYRLEGPVSHPLGLEGYLAVQPLFGLQSGPISLLYPNEEDLAALGLDDPWMTAAVKSESLGDFSLRFTEPDLDGTVLIYRDGVPLLYTARADSLPWLYARWQDMISSHACAPPLGLISRVTVSADGADYVFDITAQGEDGIAVKMNGELIDSENFSRFYETAAAATLGEPTGESPAGSPVLSVTYHGGTERRTVSFYESASARRYLIRADKLDGFLTTSRYAEDLLFAVGRITTGGIVPTYLG